MGERGGKKLKGALRWRLTKAETAAFLRDAAEADPGDLALKAQADAAEEGRIEARGDLALYWRAFFDLTHDRTRGAFGGATPIPFGALDRWALRYAVEGEEFEYLKILIQDMDAEFLAVQAEQARQRDGER